MRTLISVLMLFAGLSSCGEVDREPFELSIISSEVNPQSFDEVKILISPRNPSESFGTMNVQRLFNDNVRVSNSGRDLLLTIEAPWFRLGNEAEGMERIRVALPLFAVEGDDSPSGNDPSVTVYFAKNGAYIAEGSANLPWPLPDGGNTQVEVTCKDNVQSTCLDP